MVKCKISIKNSECFWITISIKNSDPKALYLLLPHKKKDHDNFLKDTYINLDLITYNDFINYTDSELFYLEMI